MNALLWGETLTAAGDYAGVTRQTVAVWLREDPDFRAEYAARRLELWNGIRRGLEARILEAVDALHRLIRDPSPYVRIAACRAVLDLVARTGPAEGTQRRAEDAVTTMERMLSPEAPG